MKKVKNLILFVIFGVLLTSCSNDDDKFTGSPVGNLQFETITGQISVDADFALPGQEINFTATIPDEFRALVTDTVTVQATAYSMGGSIRNASVDILPGETSGTDKIIVPGGGGTFDLNFNVKLTAIALKKTVAGKHYLITSNTVNVASGSSGVPTTNDKRLKLSVDWENKTIVNKLRVRVERVGLTTMTIRGTQGSGNIKVGSTTYPINFNTDLATTAATFVNDNLSTFQTAHGITLSSVGSDIQFAYTSVTPPVITITAVGTGTNGIRGDIYSDVIAAAAGDWPKSYFFAANKLGSTSEGVASATGVSPYAYTPGVYKVKIGVNTNSDLATSPLDLKYRLVLRYPNGDVKIYSGVYNNLSASSGYKPVLTITKTGLGDSSSYTDEFTP